MGEPWELSGTVLVACNCDYGCPCNFNAPPTHGACEGGWTWRVEEGRYGDVSLDGIAFSVMAKWPGAIHEGDGVAFGLVDERASGAQREAVATLLSGDVGGPWGILGWTWPTFHGPRPVAYELELDGLTSRLRAGEEVALEMAPIRNPVSGAEVHPGAVLPEGLIFARGDFASATLFRVGGELGYEHADTYAAVGQFHYRGP